MNLVTSAEMADLDASAQSEFGIPGIVLMESAAKSAWDYFEKHHLCDQPKQSIVFVAGAGNNGGDALVMARYCILDGRHQATVVLTRESLKGDAEAQRQILVAMGVPLLVWERDRSDAESGFHGANWIVDGIAGTGLSGSLRSPLSEIVCAVNAASARVVAIDTPSGVGDRVPSSGDAVCADLTLTLGVPKRCLYDPAHRGNCGCIAVIPFTLPKQLADRATCPAELLDGDDLADLVPPLAPTAYKGERGVLAIFAGSTGTAGAAVLASQGALSSGAGLVTLFADDSVLLPIASQLTSVMVRPEGESVADGLADRGRFGATVVGPGWGRTPRRATQLVEIFTRFSTGVVDADGLTLLSDLAEPPSLSNWVLTPHPGELSRLVGASKAETLSDMYGSALHAAQKFGAVVVAKASTTIIARPDGRMAVVDGMNPALATAGSGDVLSGVIGALLSRGMSAWDAARAGTVLHAAAGRGLARSAGFFRSAQLPGEIGRVLGSVLLTG
jgi:ADP-dependent NAD(P)H-hydrate dehydratase / NAD(P)H-hydrate epimerase